MGKASIDDCLTDHPKFLAAGPVAGWLWLAGLLYARRTLTNGFIPKVKVPSLVLGLKRPYEVASMLVRVQLWDEAVGGYQIHHYDDFNPTREQVRSYQEADRIRKQSKRHGQSDVRPDSCVELPYSDPDNSRTGYTRGTHADAKSESASESESTSALGSAGKSAREPAALAPIRQSRHRQSLIGLHHNCPAFTGSACERGLCVPGGLYREWMRQLGGESTDYTASEQAIGAMVDRAIAALQPGGISEDGYRFWRAVWATEHAPQAPARPSSVETRDAHTLRAARSLL